MSTHRFGVRGRSEERAETPLLLRTVSRVLTLTRARGKAVSSPLRGFATALQSAAALLLATSALAQITRPPLPAREFRGTWIATVRCVDWPSEPGLPTEKQKKQLLDQIDKAASLGLNAIVFQVRPAGDAMYQSSIEPWSPWLTGEIGKAPSPLWDPLEFAVTEAHKRGMELHAWFNPYRALATTTRFTPKGNHICAQHPEWTMRYHIDTWMDPGEPGVRERTKAVILDVTRRYDVDGIHIDDYFYPYPVKGANGELAPFPDDKSFKRYQAAGGKLELPAWRRENVDTLVRELYEGIKGVKRWVKFGISPFGLWRPGFPEGTGGGLDPYEDLGADSRKWLQSGWVDYLAPQLYWPIEPAKLSFTTYYDWWLEQNTMGRHIFPGMALDRIGKDRGPGEILRQISEVRARQSKAVPGHLHWNFGALYDDKGKIGTLTKQRAYQTVALPPATPWLSQTALPVPTLSFEKRSDGLFVKWGFQDASRLPQARWWVMQAFIAGKWDTLRALPGSQLEIKWPDKAEAVAIRAAGNGWELSEAAFTAGRPQ